MCRQSSHSKRNLKLCRARTFPTQNQTIQIRYLACWGLLATPAQAASAGCVTTLAQSSWSRPLELGSCRWLTALHLGIYVQAADRSARNGAHAKAQGVQGGSARCGSAHTAVHGSCPRLRIRRLQPARSCATLPLTECHLCPPQAQPAGSGRKQPQHQPSPASTHGRAHGCAARAAHLAISSCGAAASEGPRASRRRGDRAKCSSM